MLEMHKRYGDVVRIAPDELAFSHPDAWQDIMGHRKGQHEFIKADWFYRPVEDQPTHVVNAARDQHGRLRRQLAHGFSEKAMRDQEPLIRGYVDLLLDRLSEFCASGSSVVLSDWYNFTTFDIIGDLAFGEPFGCLQGSDLDGWIQGIFDAGRLGILLQTLSFYPLLKRILIAMAPKSMKEAHEKHKRMTQQKMMRRMEKEEGRPDLIEGLLRKKDELSLTVDELISNAEILIIGGSETTASLLSGVTYLLLANPEAHDKLKAEVRSAFQRQKDINLISVNGLPYMLACLDEAMRMYPPIANGLPRLSPDGGAIIGGQHIPPKTFVSVHHWSLYRREEYFKDPNNYHPERFLGDPAFADDRREVLQPFHVGPRNCLGRNLAYSEMRLILALIIFKFDITLDHEAKDWMNQRNFLMWEKGPLKVHLSLV
ncbi:Cytochrome P450 [Penicillium brevicompactum]|uniref:Cytochrome P450 n=1 Tax=Penicillium brevicompactum TaxID=5074 RepID=UPI0025407073|nr:Cytochrome P450 [Penicillium brevicompactum]KAJ5344108.1 Cytochrome P450 [Penicillium brevicompactum]